MEKYDLARKIVDMTSKLAIFAEYEHDKEDYQSKRSEMFADFCKFIYGEVIDNLK